MSIASEITRITDNVSDSYTAANAKGATMPATQDSDHLAATIATIPSGITPTGTMYIISNGTYNVEDKAIANVNVPTTAPAHYVEKSVDANGELKSGTSFIDLTGVTRLSPNALAYAYAAKKAGNNTDITAVDTTVPAFNNVDLDFSNVSIDSAALNYAFFGKKGINSVTLKQHLFNGSTGIDIGAYCFAHTDVKTFTYTGTEAASFGSSMVYGCLSMQSFLCPNLTEMYQSSFYDCCHGCTSLVTIDLSKVETIGKETESGNYVTASSMFNGCTQIQSAYLNKLKTIYGGQNSSGSARQMFYGCTSLTTFEVDSLQTIGNGYYSGSNYAKGLCSEMFRGCSSLPTVAFKSLTSVGSYGLNNGFYGCTSLTDLWFYALQTVGSIAFSQMLSGVTGCTVHFPMAIQSTYGSDTRFTGGFGGTSTTVLFDLVTSLTGADTNTYTRSEKDSTSTATAWLYNDTLYYTSGVSNHTAGVNEPAVNDTIYSDAACTTAVTTISAIA